MPSGRNLGQSFLMLTSHMMSLPDLVTPAFCVLPADTWTTSVFSIGSRRGEVIPLPHVYTEDSGGGMPVFAEYPTRPPDCNKSTQI